MITIKTEDEVFINELVECINGFIKDGYIVPDDGMIHALKLLSTQTPQTETTIDEKQEMILAIKFIMETYGNNWTEKEHPCYHVAPNTFALLMVRYSQITSAPLITEMGLMKIELGHKTTLLSSCESALENRDKRISGLEDDIELWKKANLSGVEIIQEKNQRISELEREGDRIYRKIWEAFFLSVCELPKEEQNKHWGEFVKENNL